MTGAPCRRGHPVSLPSGPLRCGNTSRASAGRLDQERRDSFPYDGNDHYGDCMYAAACHGDNTFTGNVGTESVFDQTTLIKDYLALSGGDNGLDEGMILGEWKKGLASTPAASIFGSVDIDPTNANLMQAAIYLFGGVQFQLAVPDVWINDFTTGAVWDAPGDR